MTRQPTWTRATRHLERHRRQSQAVEDPAGTHLAARLRNRRAAGRAIPRRSPSAGRLGRREHRCVRVLLRFRASTTPVAHPHPVRRPLRPDPRPLRHQISRPETGPHSYHTIATSIDVPPHDILFLSDTLAELNAARQAGWKTLGVSRPEDGAPDLTAHPSVSTLNGVVMSTVE